MTSRASRITFLDIRMADDGHRSAYANFFSSLFDIERLGLNRRALFSRLPVLVPMVEESFGRYVGICLVRALLGRRTAGLLFRPRPVLEEGSLRLRIKYLVLRFLRVLPSVSTLTILPYSVEPRFAEISDGWIYDPQLWDLSDPAGSLALSGFRKLAMELREAASGRRICVALGRQDRSKGFDWFARMYTNDGALRESVLFAFGGKVSGDLKDLSASFSKANGFACERFISDDELFEFYACADLVWCAYGKDYDQASGILGRAVQMGIPVIVRRNSLVHRLCEIEGFAHVAIDEADHVDFQAALPSRVPEEVSVLHVRSMRDASMQSLHAALGLSPR